MNGDSIIGDFVKKFNNGKTKYLGVVEFGEVDYTTVLDCGEYLVFGGATNSTFLVDGYIDVEDGETLDQTIQGLIEDLNVWANDGAQYMSRVQLREVL